MRHKRIAYIFQDVGGWFYCDDAAEMLDTRGAVFTSKNAVIRRLKDRRASGDTDYTHYRTGTTKPRKI